MAYRVIYSDEARDHLVGLNDFISRESSPEIARRYVDAIVARCDSLEDFPFRGSRRDDVRKGMRTLAFRGRVTIVYSVHDDRVVIIGVVYAGRDPASLFDE